MKKLSFFFYFLPLLITILFKGFINCFKELIKLRLIRVDYRTKRDEKKNYRKLLPYLRISRARMTIYTLEGNEQNTSQDSKQVNKQQ